MPAPAVIPALIAYIKVVAVKKLVVGFWVSATGLLRLALACIGFAVLLSGNLVCRVVRSGMVTRPFTLKKLECLRQAIASAHISQE